MMDGVNLFFTRHARLWSAAYSVVVLALIVAALYTLGVSVWRGPWRDTWEAMPVIQKALGGQATLVDYWEQYGYSHRPLVSRWLWVADLRWVAGSNGLLLAVSLAMQALVFFSVRAALLRDASFTLHQRCIVLVGTLFCLLNITQVFNLLHTFDVQWFLVVGFVTLSLDRLLAGAEQKSSGALVVAWLCIFIASLNNFSALVMWPIEILLLVALGYPMRKIAIFMVATVLYLTMYFYGLPTGGSVLLGDLPQQSWQQILAAIAGILVVFPLWYLSNPLSFQLSTEGPLHMPWPVSWVAPIAMGLLLLFAVYAWLQSLLRRKQYNAVAYFGLSLVLYGYGVGVVTALGRGLFWDNVYALRYQNIVLLFWIGIVLWLASSVRWRHLGLAAGALLLLLVFASRASWYHELILKTGNRTRDAHLALVVGLENHVSAIQATVSRSHLFEGTQYTLEHEAQFLREINAGPYADPAWRVPAFISLQHVAVCENAAADFDVHGDDASYARLAMAFAQPVHYGVIAWFDEVTSAPGLLIATRADSFAARVQQSVAGFTSYAGFAKQLPQQKPRNVFARDGESWCRLALE